MDIAKLLIDNGADIHAKTKHGTTPLHYACRRGALEVIKLLLIRGANLGAESNEMTTPLHEAGKESPPDFVFFLVRQHPWLVAKKWP